MLERDSSSKNLDWDAMGALGKAVIDSFGWQQKRRREIIVHRVIRNLERKGYAL